MRKCRICKDNDGHYWAEVLLFGFYWMTVKGSFGANPDYSERMAREWLPSQKTKSDFPKSHVVKEFEV